MCRDPIEFILNPKSPSFIMVWGIVIGVILWSYFVTGYPTLNDILSYPYHMFEFLKDPIAWLIIGFMGLFFGGIEINGWYQQREWEKKTTHERWYELMHSSRYFANEAEDYYYGDISN